MLIDFLFWAESCSYTDINNREKAFPGVQLIVDEYIQKLNHYCTVDDVQLQSNPRNAMYIHICPLLSNLGLIYVLPLK